jgi:hypothetical protein
MSEYLLSCAFFPHGLDEVSNTKSQLIRAFSNEIRHPR